MTLQLINIGNGVTNTKSKIYAEEEGGSKREREFGRHMDMRKMD